MAKKIIAKTTFSLSSRIVVLSAGCLAFLVVMLGAYTRLTHAGLGCPDWPGCYGHMVLPDNFLSTVADSRKAWTEMLHRYAAGTLGLLIFFLGFKLLLSKRHAVSVWLPAGLMVLVIAQALLGMWTVTLKLLPVVVMSHLLGGILIFSLLSRLGLQMWQKKPQAIRTDAVVWRLPVLVGMLILFVQIALGGWVSANYAGIGCIGFPKCNGQWFPPLHFADGFNLFSPVGANYQGGVLDNAARVSIQMVHRAGAVITFLYLSLLAVLICLRVKNQKLILLAASALVLVVVQVSLGILNVVKLLPLGVAVAHNGVAALLMAVLMMMFYMCKENKEICL